MKRALLFLIFICAPWVLMGQKKGISYQAVILDPSPLDIPGNPISGQPLQKGKVTIRFSIGNAVSLDYVEIQETETDEFGLINLMIGQGNTNGSLNTNTSSLPNAKFNSFDSIIWDENQKTLAVSVSFDGGKTFSQVSNQKLSFSPYALYAEAVEYKNVREAPKKLSQFANDSGYLIPKDLDPISEELSVTNKTIRTNQLLADQNFAIVDQQIFSLSDSIQLNSRSIAKNTFSISDIEKKLVDVNGLISETKNESQSNLNRLSSTINGLQTQLYSTNNALSNLASTYEIVDNKSTATDLGNASPSDQLYPTQKAIKTYVDTKVADLAGGSIADATTLASGKIQLAGDLGGTASSPTVPGLTSKENIANKSTDVISDSNSDTKYPTVKAVKSYVDQATQGIALQANLDAKANSTDVNAALGTKENASNKSNNIALGNSEELFPTQKAVKTYVDNQVANGIVSDADVSTKGKIQLAGDLGGTAASPTVPGLVLKANAADVTTALLSKANAAEVTSALSLKANTADVTAALALKANASDLTNAITGKEEVSNKSTSSTLGTSDVFYPSQKAVKTYVDAQVASGAPDADASTKGKIQLAGDLGGTAASPTVPGLALKADAADVSSALLLKANTSDVTSSLALKANSADVTGALISKANVSDVTNSLALKAPINNPTFTGTVGGLDKSMVGLSNIDNTSDANKPVSSATQTALNLKANANDVNSALALKANSTDVATDLALKANASDVTSALANKENSSNKSTSATLGTSDVFYPSQKAVKTYVDAQVASGAPDADASTKGKIQLAGDLGGTAASPTVPGLALKADAADVSSALLLKANTSDVTSSLALKANSADVTGALISKANVSDVTNSLALKAPINNPTFTGTVGGLDKSMVGLSNIDNTSDANKPVSSATQTALNLKANANDVNSALALKANSTDVATDLALKANASDVTSALANKENSSNKSTSATLGTSDVFYPSQKAVKTYVDAQVASGAPDADASTKGKIQLAGDLGGTAASPTVPGLALKADAADVSSALLLKANTSDVTSSLALKANSADVTGALISKANVSDVTNSLALKAPINNPTFTGTVGGLDKSMVGLSNIDNTSDANKPVSSATQTALNLKANANDVNSALALKANSTDVATDLALKANASDVTNSLALKAPINNPTFTGTVGGLDKSMVGLSNIDNTSDANKPVSSATQTALNLKANANDVNSALALKANSTDVATDLALKANASDVTSALANKENSSNKSTSATLGTSDVFYPSQKAVKTYVDAQVASGAPDADASTKGKIQLSGDLGGTGSTASNPVISNSAVNTNKLADNSVTSSKIVNGTIATNDLADNLITNSKIANYAVDTDEIANGAVTDSKINSVSGSKVNGNISGGAASLVNSRSIYGNSFNGTSSLNQIISSTYGGTGNGFTKFSGPSSSEKTFTLPNSNATLLSSAATVTVAQGGTGANTLASNQVLLGNGTGTIQSVAPGSAGNVLMSNGSTWVSASNSAPDNTHSIGDSYGGGIIFYVYDGGAHGLIAATSDQSSSIDWDLGSSFETRAKANGVGAGLKNTSILIASLLSQRNNWNYDNYNSQNFAAALCNEYTKSETINNIETTYGDWYLPSKYELNLLYMKRSVVGNFSSAKYWSSTEYDGTKAWTINFGTQSGSAESSQDKNSSFRVRAIRAF